MTRRWAALDISALDDLIQAAVLDFDVAAIDEDAARVFFQSAEERDRAAAALQQQFPSLLFTSVDVPDEDWAARSQANLKSVRVGNIVIAPPWDVPPDSPGTIAIIIQPSMGFGTGHHASTRLCLAHLQEIDIGGRSAIDVGTGSGVLAIAANRLRAAPVLAIDDDPDAIQAARENLDLNPGTEVTLGTLDLRRAALRPFDLVLANLTGGLLVSAAATLLQLTARGGRLILSGLMNSEEPDVLAAFASCEVERRSQEDEWVCVSLLRR